jgi:hypothetical protein
MFTLSMLCVAPIEIEAPLSSWDQFLFILTLTSVFLYFSPPMMSQAVLEQNGHSPQRGHQRPHAGHVERQSFSG